MTENNNFRTKTATIDEYGKRKWVFAKLPKGKLTNYRRTLGFILFSFFLAAPHIKVHGEPLMLLGFAERKFILFGSLFWPQDSYILAILMLTIMVFLILFTVIYGRIFCGWLCPQTVFLEFIFRPIEHLIDGNVNQQRKLKAQKWGFSKIFKRVLKYSIFALIAFIIVNTLFSWVLSFDGLIKMYKEPFHLNIISFIFMGILTSFILFVYGWFREQVCSLMCPYGRLQGALLDDNSIVVSYDYVRGEPRGRNADPNSGDCIDCKSCVNVCPTGIDIRNGLQLECVNCTACIDTCNDVMKRMNKPSGLIRLASENQISKKLPFKINTRIIAYTSVLFILVGFFSFLLLGRTDVETTILRTPGMTYQEVGTDSTSNLYNIKIVNKTHNDLPVNIRLLSHKGEIKMIKNTPIVPDNELIENIFFVILPNTEIKNEKEMLNIGIFNEDNFIDKIEVSFVGKPKD